MGEPSGLQALVVDYGGVLTTPLTDTMAAWAETDQVDPQDLRAVLREWFGAPMAAMANPAHALERGEMTVPDFEARLADRLSERAGRPVSAEGLLRRMFAGFRAEPPMVDVVRRARAAGLKTALLSNSWGLDYDRSDWAELFEATVVSGEVGMRKPEPEIYRLTARRLGVAPQRCVFVDDLAPNVRGAVAAGMVGIHHVTPEQTILELEALLPALAAGAGR